MSLEDRVALVTGGTRGIGLGIAEALLQDGWNLLVNGVRAPSLAAPALDGLRAKARAGTRVEYVAADVSQSQDRARLIGEVNRLFGRLDLLVNNAGVGVEQRVDLLEATEDSFDRLIRIDAKAPHFLTQAAARWMIEQKRADAMRRPAIVNVGSISAFVVSTNRGEYCMAKAALHQSTLLWADRLAEYGIAVYEVQPGIIATDMTAPVKDKYDALTSSDRLLERRCGLPQDIGKVVAMLARGDLPYAPGATLVIDGGLTIQRL